MIFLSLLSLLLASLSFAAPSAELLLENRAMVEAVPFVAERYDQLPAKARQGFSEASYAGCVASLPAQSVSFFRVRYLSDGLKVAGVAALPKGFVPGKRYPLVVFNRGGNREFGRITACTLRTIADRYSNQGEYIVLATQYRGVAGGEGREEYGGRDVNDVLDLLRIGQSYSFVHAADSFLIGHSRGGMMAYLALKQGAAVRAAVISAGTADLLSWERDRPEMAAVFAELIPGLERDRAELLKQRSAVYWAGELTRVPTLILHGTADQQVPHSQAKDIAERIERAGGVVKLVSYPGEGHHFNGRGPEVKAEIHRWLRAHRR